MTCSDALCACWRSGASPCMFSGWRTWRASLSPTLFLYACCDLATAGTDLASFRSYGYSNIRYIVMCVVHWLCYHSDYLCCTWTSTMVTCIGLRRRRSRATTHRSRRPQGPTFTCFMLYLLLLPLHSTLIGLIWNLKYSLRFSGLNLVLLYAAIWCVGFCNLDWLRHGFDRRWHVSRCCNAATGDTYSRPETDMVGCGRSPQGYLNHISHRRPGGWSQ